MKKVYLFIGLMLSALAIGCTNSGTEEQTPNLPNDQNKVTVTVNATLPGDLTWVAGQSVAINGLVYSTFNGNCILFLLTYVL